MGSLLLKELNFMILFENHRWFQRYMIKGFHIWNCHGKYYMDIEVATYIVKWWFFMFSWNYWYTVYDIEGPLILI